MNLIKTPKQKNSVGDTELLIDSMLKLIDHMSENQKHQEEIFETMTVEDIQKIIKNLDDHNLILRKTSAAFLCLLLYANYEVQRKFCQTLNIFFSEGKICLNQIPQSFQINAKFIPEILLTIKASEIPKDFPLCWYYEMPKDKNFKSGLKNLKLDAFDDLQAKQRVQKFFDPKKILFGFYVYNKNTDFSSFLLSFQDENSITKETTNQKNRDSANSQRRCFSPIQKNDRSSEVFSTRKLPTNMSVDQKIQKVKSDKKSAPVPQNQEFFSFKKSENDIMRLTEESNNNRVDLKPVPIKGKISATPTSNSPNPSGSFHSKYTSTRTNSQMNHSFDMGYSGSQKDQKSAERAIFSNPFANKQIMEPQIKTIHEEPNKYSRAPTAFSNPYYQTNTTSQKQTTVKQKQISLKK